MEFPSEVLQPTSPASPVVHNCPNCAKPMTDAGILEFRVGGYTGIAGSFLGGWNQLAERLQPFTVLHCPTCGKIEFYEARL